MASPTHTEAYASHAEAEKRLRQIGARYVKEYSDRGEFNYWSGRTGQWVQAQRRNSQYILAFYKECPCTR